MNSTIVNSSWALIDTWLSNRMADDQQYTQSVGAGCSSTSPCAQDDEWERVVVVCYWRNMQSLGGTNRLASVPSIT